MNNFEKEEIKNLIIKCDYSNALKKLESKYSSFPNDIYIIDTLIDVYFNLDKIEECVKTIKKSIKFRYPFRFLRLHKNGRNILTQILHSVADFAFYAYIRHLAKSIIICSWTVSIKRITIGVSSVHRHKGYKIYLILQYTHLYSPYFS